MEKKIYLVVIAQFLCTSVWFAGNSVLPDLILNYQIDKNFIAHITSAVQLGFILGTLLYAFWGLSDKYSPSKVFAVSACLAALFNLLLVADNLNSLIILSLRFLTGFFLAGVYPVGMKIVADYKEKGLGKSLGLLVGALVLGTALPHLLKSVLAGVKWEYVIAFTSSLSFLGAMLVWVLVPDGPFRKVGTHLKIKQAFSAFKNRELKVASIGYFGHMWELYAFWAFVPILLKANFSLNSSLLDVSFYSFLVIAAGFISCIIAGRLSVFHSEKKVAKIALSLSGICCVLLPFVIYAHTNLFIVFLICWAMFVVADSPLFSTLVAQKSPPGNRGSILTLVNCIGYSITILSIQLLQYLSVHFQSPYIYTVLAVGPLVGVLNLHNNNKS